MSSSWEVTTTSWAVATPGLAEGEGDGAFACASLVEGLGAGEAFRVTASCPCEIFAKQKHVPTMIRTLFMNFKWEMYWLNGLGDGSADFAKPVKSAICRAFR